MPEIVFYSWQSDLPNKTNRNLIEAALRRAIGNIDRDAEIDASPRLDQDTRGLPGSPDITSAIFEKIDGAAAFVADLSIINSKDKGRPSPNPNVLIELGYALKSLKSDKILMVFNSEFGQIDDLPFDLGMKRVMSYTLAEDSGTADARNELSNRLQEALELIFKSSTESSHSAELSQFVVTLMSELISFLALAEQAEARQLNPWFDDDKYQFGLLAGSLRDLSTFTEAFELEIDVDLRDTGRLIDQITGHSRAMGPDNWNEYLGKVAGAIESVREILKKLTESWPISTESLSEIKRTIQAASRSLTGLAFEAEHELETNSYQLWEDLRGKAASEGGMLLNLSYYDLSGLGIDTVAFQELALEIHQIELLPDYGAGSQRINTILNTVIDLSRKIDVFCQSIT